LRLLSFHPAASVNRARDRRSLHTFGHSTDKSSRGVEHLSASLAHATISSSSSDDEDMSMTDPSTAPSSDQGFRKQSWPPFGAEHLCRFMNTNQITGIFLSSLPLVYRPF